MPGRPTQSPWHQAELFVSAAPRHRTALQARLQEGLPRPVRLVLHNNRVSMLSVTHRPDGRIHVRAHRGFADAPVTVIEALRTYLAHRKKKDWEIVRRFAETLPVESGSPARKRPVAARTRGTVHDLARIRDEVNQTFFSGRVECRITWGRGGSAPRGKRRRSILYGAYDATTRTVRLHPRLDAADVPHEFVRYIVFHEMLHAVVPPVRREGRWVHHTKQFRHFENQYPGIQEMRRFARALLRKS
jgi:hypothetical protein